MSIHSPHFWLFLLTVVCCYYLVPARFRWVLLLGASYYFYASFDRRYVPLLLLPTAVTYLAGLALARTERRGYRRIYLLGTLLALLGLLAVFKYMQFLEPLISTIPRVLTGGRFEFDWPMLLPIGISFFIFKLLSYILDVYHQRIPAEKHPGLFALYVSFFPQLLAGPIERAKTLLPQLRSPASFDAEKINQAIALIAWGLFKKLVVADRLGLYVNEVWKNPDGQGLHLLFAVYFY
ncbi:MAG TPA: MBOAT family protein, partial [Acidobacteriota bacterium]|nr:MBOAT family protein [Acidobacteriota bacterium]